MTLEEAKGNARMVLNMCFDCGIANEDEVTEWAKELLSAYNSGLEEAAKHHDEHCQYEGHSEVHDASAVAIRSLKQPAHA